MRWTSFRLVRWLCPAPSRHRPGRARCRLRIESLEDRIAPSTWVGGGIAGDCHGTNNGSAWSNPANWFGGVPGPGDPAVFTHNVSYTCDGNVHTGPAAAPTLDGSYTIGSL